MSTDISIEEKILILRKRIENLSIFIEEEEDRRALGDYSGDQEKHRDAAEMRLALFKEMLNMSEVVN